MHVQNEVPNRLADLVLDAMQRTRRAHRLAQRVLISAREAACTGAQEDGWRRAD